MQLHAEPETDQALYGAHDGREQEAGGGRAFSAGESAGFGQGTHALQMRWFSQIHPIRHADFHRGLCLKKERVMEGQ